MSGKRYCLLVVLMVVASCVGGAVSARVLSPRAPSAEKVAEIPEVIRAQRFEVFDEDGYSRGDFGVDTEGNVGLTLDDKDGKPRVALGVVQEKPLLWLGEMWTDIGSVPTQGPSVWVSGTEGTVKIEATDDGPTLWMHDKGARHKALLALADGAAQYFGLWDLETKEKVDLALRKEGPVLRLIDKEGNVVFKAPFAE